jgi:hypothetical protein
MYIIFKFSKTKLYYILYNIIIFILYIIADTIISSRINPPKIKHLETPGGELVGNKIIGKNIEYSKSKIIIRNYEIRSRDVG